MMICETPEKEIERIALSCGVKVSKHALKRIRQRLAPVQTDSFKEDFELACKKYQAGKAKRKKKLRITKGGVITRIEYYVRLNGVTYVFSDGFLISVYV